MTHKIKRFTYKPEYLALGLSINSVLWLSELLDRAYLKGYDPVYVFNAPCDHQAYRQGDNWTERTGLSIHQLKAAKAALCTRVHRGDCLADLKRTRLDDGAIAPLSRVVLMWIGRDNIPYYWVNTELLAMHMQSFEQPMAEPAPPYDSGSTHPHMTAPQTAPINTTNQHTINDTKYNDDVVNKNSQPSEEVVQAKQKAPTETEAYLLSYGLTKLQAGKYRDKHLPFVRAWVDWIDRYEKTNSKVGYLVKALEHGWAIPTSKRPSFDSQNKYSMNGIKTYAEAQASQDDYTSGKYAWAIDS